MEMDNEILSSRCSSLLLNAEDVAVRLRISKRYAYHLMAKNIIPSVRIGRAVRVRAADLIAYVATLERSVSYDGFF